MFQAEGDARLTVKIDSIRFVTPDVAIEDGTASVVRPGEAPSESTYTVVFVKKDGRWLIDSDHETVLPAGADGVRKTEGPRLDGRHLGR